jgi:chromosome segregation ATPase
MKPAAAFTLVMLAAPTAALSQVSYSRAWIPSGQPVVTSRVCADRQDVLTDRKYTLDREKRDNDAELASIEDEGARLAAELRNLDNRNPAAVDDYNARSDAHNRRVAAHNRRVADMNAEVADLTSDMTEAAQYCTSRGWTWSLR